MNITPQQESICNTVRQILNDNLPEQAFKLVKVRGTTFSGNYLMIFFAASAIDMHNVELQKPQCVGLSLDFETMELCGQHYGGFGGTRIDRKPNLDHPRERYLAMAGEQVPFRQPKKELKFVLAAIERFCKAWLQTLRVHRDTLCYADIVDYETLLKEKEPIIL